MAQRGGRGSDDRAAKQARLRRLMEIERLHSELHDGNTSGLPSMDSPPKAQNRKGGGKGSAGSRGNAFLRDSAGTSDSHGGKGGSGGAGATKLDRSRANMWPCGQCGFTDNFAYKLQCHGCQAPRPAQTRGGGASRSSPACGGGVGGQWTSVQASSRTRGTSPSPPSAPVSPTTLSSPTVSLASRPAGAPLGASAVPPGQATSSAPRVGNGSVRNPGGAVGANGYGPMLSRGSTNDVPKPAEVDEQGFTRVRGRYRQPKDDKSWLKPQEEYPPLQPAAGSVAQDAAAGPSEQPEGTGKGQGGIEIITVDDDYASSVHSVVPTLDQLRDAYEASQRMVRTVEASGDAADGSPVLAAARAARDQARAAFEAARPQRPAHLRMRPVEQRLERARKACDATRGKMRQLQADYKFRLSELEMELDDAQDRLSKAQAEYDSVLSQLPRSKDDRARAERCHGVLRALRAAGPELQGIAESLRGISPAHAEGIRRVVAALDHEYQETTAAVQNDAAYFRIDEADDDQLDEEDGEMEHDLFDEGPVQPGPRAGGGEVPAAAATRAPVLSHACGPASARPRVEEGPLPPPPKRFCDGNAAMEDAQGDAEVPLTVERCLEMARAANVQIEDDLASLSPLELRSWAISHGF